MEVVSLKFAVLAVLSILLYYTLPNRYRLWYLVLLSGGFIASFSPLLIVYVVFYALINFLFGRLIRESKAPKTYYRLGLLLNLTQLILLRYSSFMIDPILSLFNTGVTISVVSDYIVPIGISYYTLQGIGYLINIKMGWEKPESDFLRFLIFIIYFPKFLSGPIERSNNFLPQCDLQESFNPQKVTSGLRIALLGFFKKIIIANHLGQIVVQLFASPEDFAGYQIALIILLQPLYLYFDFSGYTDIAIGLSRALGIELRPNFDKPFLAENMTTFWRRFHISLSSWFNDYVFKQTSFKLRKLKGHATLIAIFLTWTLFGVWHGAGWNFMVLGMLQAIAIYYEYRTKNFRNKVFSIFPGYSRKVVGRIFTYSFYAISLTFFFAPDLPMALRLISDVFQSEGAMAGPPIHGLSIIFWLFIAFIFLVFEVLEHDFYSLYFKLQQIWIGSRILRIIVYYAAIMLILMQIDGGGSFIYEMF